MLVLSEEMQLKETCFNRSTDLFKMQIRDTPRFIKEEQMFELGGPRRSIVEAEETCPPKRIISVLKPLRFEKFVLIQVLMSDRQSSKGYTESLLLDFNGRCIWPSSRISPSTPIQWHKWNHVTESVSCLKCHLCLKTQLVINDQLKIFTSSLNICHWS